MRKALGLGFNLVLAVSACSSNDRTTVQDAAMPDMAGQADGPQTSPDRTDGRQPEDGAHDLSKTAGVKADVGAMDVAYPIDVVMDTTAVDVRLLVDITVDRQVPDALDAATMPVEAGSEVALSIGFPCRDDSECCIAVDECEGMAYLYSKGPGAAPPPNVSGGGDTGCVNCSPPGIQLRCTAGQCQGEVIPYTFYLDPLTLAHCGFLPRADGGIAMKQENPSSDGGTTIGTKTAWGCGGGRPSNRSSDVAP
jgi:hypothetical protein